MLWCMVFAQYVLSTLTSHILSLKLNRTARWCLYVMQVYVHCIVHFADYWDYSFASSWHLDGQIYAKTLYPF